MFQFLQPISLFALAGISVPLLIHLWNHRPGKIRKVGSIFLLSPDSKQYARKIKWSELLLLLLRSLLIAFVALALARPLWKQPPGTDTKGWILADERVQQQEYVRFKPLIDSLLAAGFEYHAFQKGFPKKDPATFFNPASDRADGPLTSYWDLARSLDAAVPPSLPVYLFTGRALACFRGSRPEISMPLNWQVFDPADSMAVAVAAAYQETPDSFRVILSNSKPSGTFNTYFDLSRQAAGQDFHFLKQDGHEFVSYRGSTGFPVDTATLQISIFSDAEGLDAGYVQAALEAIAHVSKRKTRITVVHDPTAIPLHSDWLFWLSDQPLKSNVAPHVFTYEQGVAQEIRSWMIMRNPGVTAGQVPVYKLIRERDTTAAKKEIIWQDGFGHNMLTADSASGSVTYHFFSHFDLSWNDLCRSGSFPALLSGILNRETLPTQTDAGSADRREIGDRQWQPAKITGLQKNHSEKEMKTTDLSDFLWIVVLLLFLAERWIVFHQKKPQPNG